MVGIKERSDRKPNLGVLWKLEVGRHDADHGVRFVVYRDRPSHYRRICVIEASPGGVAEKHDTGRAGSVLVGAKETSELRPNAEKWEEVGGDELPLEPRGLGALSDGNAPTRVRGDRGEGVRLIAPVEVIQVREAVAVAVLGVEVPERHEAIRVGKGEWAQNDRVEAGKERRVGRDAHSEANDCDEREGGVLPQRAAGVANVLEEAVHTSSPASGERTK